MNIKTDSVDAVRFSWKRLQTVKFYGILKLPSVPGGKALHITAGGITGPSSHCKGGEANAYYFDVPFVWINIYDQSKKMNRHPGTVTVRVFCLN